MQAHTLGEVDNLGTVLLRVCSGTILPIFIEIGSYFTEKEQKISWHSFSRHGVDSRLLYICDSAVFCALHDQLASLDRHLQQTRCFCAVAELLVQISCTMHAVFCKPPAHPLNLLFTIMLLLVVQRFGVGLMIERSLVRLQAGAPSSQLGQLSLPSLRGR